MRAHTNSHEHTVQPITVDAQSRQPLGAEMTIVVMRWASLMLLLGLLVPHPQCARGARLAGNVSSPPTRTDVTVKHSSRGTTTTSRGEQREAGAGGAGPPFARCEPL